MLNKRGVARELSYRTTLTIAESLQVIDELLEIVYETVKDGEAVSFVNFGKFYPYDHKERPVRNPQVFDRTEKMILAPYRAMRFRVSKKVKELLKESSRQED